MALRNLGERSGNGLAVAAVLLGCALYGAVAIPTRVLNDDYNIPMFAVSGFSFLIMTVVSGIILLIFDRKGFKLSRKGAVAIVLVGVFIAANYLFLFNSYDFLPMGIASLLEMTAPFFTIIILFLFLNKSVKTKAVLSILIGMLGCFVCLASEKGEYNPIGVVLAIGAAVTYALFYISSEFSSREGNSSMTTLFYSSLVSTLCFLPLSLSRMTESAPALLDFKPLVLLLVLAIGLIMIPEFLFFFGISKIGSTKTSILNLSEFVFSTIYGVVIFNEVITIVTVAGMIMMVVAIVVINVENTAKPKLDRFMNRDLLKTSPFARIHRRMTGKG